MNRLKLMSTLFIFAFILLLTGCVVTSNNSRNKDISTRATSENKDKDTTKTTAQNSGTTTTKNGVTTTIKKSTSKTEKKTTTTKTTKLNVDHYKMSCYKDTHRGKETSIFSFKNGVIYKYRIELVVTNSLNVDDVYHEEEVMNGGRYRLSKKGRTIIHELNESDAFWKDKSFGYKDTPMRYINKEFVENGYECDFADL